MARGGRRNGTPGKAYANRTDLQTGAKPLPVTTAPGQPYGASKAQQDAQAAVPMAGTPMPAVSAPAQPVAPWDGPMAGEVTGLLAPSERPDEPVTHGLPIGAGGGTELFPSAPSLLMKGMALLNTLGDQLTPELKAVARALNLSQVNGVNE